MRSTQCAVLIALATAAGILRIESNPTQNGRSATDKGQANCTSASRGRQEPVQFQVALAGLAPWLQLHQASSEHDVLAMPDVSTITRRTKVIRRQIFLPEVTRLSPRLNWFPFAVGPPLSCAPSNRRADRTSVPGDSPARRTVTYPIALVVDFLRAQRASETRTLSWPSRVPNPSYALRGEPEFQFSSPTSAQARGSDCCCPVAALHHSIPI
jgi:hypothetical protein